METSGRYPAGSEDRPIEFPPATTVDVTEAEFTAIVSRTVAGTFTPLRGLRYFIGNGPLGGNIFEWNGESFGGFSVRPISVLGAPVSRSSENSANDTSELTLAQVTIPGLLMRACSKLRITSDWAYDNNATAKQMVIKLGGSNLGAPSFTTTVATKILTEVQNYNSLTAQRAFNGTNYSAQGNAHLSLTLDTRTPLLLEFRAKWGAQIASNTITLLGYTVELVP